MELSNIIPALLERLDQKSRYYVFAGIAAVIFILSFFIFTRPQLVDLAKMAPKIKEVLGDIKKAEEEIKKGEGYLDQVDQLREKIRQANQQVVPREDASVLLSTLARFADENKIKVSQMISNPQYQRLVLEKGNYRYFSFPVQFEARGGYHDFARFLNVLERRDTFLVVRSCTISANKDDPQLHDISLILDSIIFEKK